MTAPEVNIPLLRKAVEWAEAEAAKPPELCEWNQLNYRIHPRDYRYEGVTKDASCGTCYCIAGFVASSMDARYAESNRVEGLHCSGFAADALGIDRDEASERGGLFWDDNTIADVRRIAEDLAGERL